MKLNFERVAAQQPLVQRKVWRQFQNFVTSTTQALGYSSARAAPATQKKILTRKQGFSRYL